ncbi:LysM peptidoglycan-binding and 3D domain-containing protein [Lentibacillus saliphilus]|uniref:LysM peptidoglycan-binding and 3D domain-containing protein n=1 Tax=Lentibacillus saliphilus TaxID=2737028 RepID=UPI001C2F3271|nr:3D domain-containing protein [Lentibacillus saliphilus]
MKKLVALCATVLIAATGTMTASAQQYEVEKGDNLWSIAQRYNTSVDRLIDINNLKTTVIQPKQKIALYETYEVKKGDTLTDISNIYHVSIAELMEWNNLYSDLILIGQELRIKETGTKIDQQNAIAAKQAVNTNTKAKTVSRSVSNNDTSKQKVEGRTIAVTATAYTAECTGCSGITYTGVDLNKNRHAKVIAVDPNLIPLGSKVYVEGYGYATAEDIGGAIKGNRIDIHVPTKTEAFNWGVREVNVTIIE